MGGEQTLKQVGEFEIEPECDARQKFQHRHFRAEPVPNRAQFQTHRARADDDELFWRLRKFERFGAADDCFTVKFRKWQFQRSAACGDDNVFRLDVLRLAIRGLNRNFSRRGNGAQAFEYGNLVRLH